ncbi:MAG: alpha/beta hydrolase [Erysipelotrichaceae bacterium]|nr:alpha/beta hydrolase [Erysipelotrichaceae bacterium]
MITLYENTNVSITPYLCDTTQPKPIVIVCPGGGYLGCSPNEGEPVAKVFNKAGFHAAVLIYTQKASNPDVPAYPQFLYDMEKALAIITEHAADWKVDTNSIYLSGFSAGAHLCSLYGNLWHTGFFATHIQPKGILLCYPAIRADSIGQSVTQNIDLQNVISNTTQQLSVHPFIKACLTALFGHYPVTDEEYKSVNSLTKINENTPPTFVWQTFNDEIINGSDTIAYVNELYRHHIPVEFHLFDKGIHGISLATEDVTKHSDEHVAHWSELAIEWIHRNQL